MDKKILLPLWKHQIKMANEASIGFKTFGYHYWFSGMGTGKTASALELMRIMHNFSDVRRVLVLTVKAAMTSVWAEDIMEQTEGFNVTVLDKGSSKIKGRKMMEWANEQDDLEFHNLPYNLPIEVVVVNYETAKLLTLERANFDMVVADESHRLSKHNSQQSLELAKRCADIPYKLEMTGTAWHDHLSQIYGQFRFLSPKLYSNQNKHTGSTLFGHWSEFESTYCHTYERDNMRFITGYKNIPEMMATVSPHITRIKTEDVIDLPDLHHVERKFEMPPKLRKAYNQMKKDMVVITDEGTGIAQYNITQQHRLHSLTRGWFIDFDTNKTVRVDGGKVAIKAVLDVLEEVGDEPIVIWTSYVQDALDLATAIGVAQKARPYLLTGQTKEHLAFQSNKGRSNVLIANISAGGTGVRLFRASYMLYYGLSPSTSRTDYEQSIARVHRVGQEGTVTAIHLVASNTVDEGAYQRLAKKEKSDEQAQDLL